MNNDNPLVEKFTSLLQYVGKSSKKQAHTARLLMQFMVWKKLTESDADTSEGSGYSATQQNEITTRKVEGRIRRLEMSSRKYCKDLFTGDYLKGSGLEDDNLMPLFDLVNSCDDFNCDEINRGVFIDFLIHLVFNYFDNRVPPELSDLIMDLVDLQPGDSVYIPFNGNETLLLSAMKRGCTKIYVEDDQDQFLNYVFTRIMGDVFEFEASDPLRAPSFLDENPNYLKKFDVVLSRLPLGKRTDVPAKRTYQRFRKPGSRVFFPMPHLEHVLSVTGGKAVVIVPDSFLFRSVSSEQTLKKDLVEKGVIQASISLPGNIFNRDTTKCSILVLEAGGDHDSVFCINGQFCFTHDPKKRKNVLTPGCSIPELLKERKEQTGISRNVDNREIRENRFNLAAETYVLTEKDMAMNKVLKKFNRVPVKSLVTIIRPQFYKPAREGRDFEAYMVGTQDIPEAGFIRQPQRGITAKQSKNIKPNDALQAYDVIVSVRGTIGLTGIVPEREEETTWVPNQVFLVFRPLDDSKKRAIGIYVYLYLRSAVGQWFMEKNTKGGQFKAINTASIRDMKIPEPDDHHLEQALERFEKERQIQEQIMSLQKEARTMRDDFFETLG